MDETEYNYTQQIIAESKTETQYVEICRLREENKMLKQIIQELYSKMKDLISY